MYCGISWDEQVVDVQAVDVQVVDEQAVDEQAVEGALSKCRLRKLRIVSCVYEYASINLITNQTKSQKLGIHGNLPLNFLCYMASYF